MVVRADGTAWDHYCVFPAVPSRSHRGSHAAPCVISVAEPGEQRATRLSDIPHTSTAALLRGL